MTKSNLANDINATCAKCSRPMHPPPCTQGGGSGDDTKQQVKNTTAAKLDLPSSTAVIMSTLTLIPKLDIVIFNTYNNDEVDDNLPITIINPEEMTISLSANTMTPKDFKALVDLIKDELGTFKEMMREHGIHGQISIDTDTEDNLVIRCSDKKTFKGLVSHLIATKLLPNINTVLNTKKDVQTEFANINQQENHDTHLYQNDNDNGEMIFNPTPCSMMPE